jgi:hypothetical protein
MPKLIPFRLAAACALALTFALCVAAPAFARGVPVHLRVVGNTGKVLADESLRTGTESIKTSRKANCFGAGTGGSGKAVTIKGATALGALIEASKFTSTLPVSISDHFDFGLALCGVGGKSATDTLSWYLKVNHKNPNIGGEDVRLHAGDEVLWALEPFPYPDELALSAPRHARAGQAFGVRVFSYDDKGKRKPAAGVTVTGASGPTGADGRATVTLKRPARLTARHGKDIPSNLAAVCVGGRCPHGSGR